MTSAASNRLSAFLKLGYTEFHREKGKGTEFIIFP